MQLQNSLKIEEKYKRIAKDREQILSKANKNLSTVFCLILDHTFKNERIIRTLQRGTKLELNKHHNEIEVKSGFHIVGTIPLDAVKEINQLILERRSYNAIILSILGRDGTNFQTSTVIENGQEKIIKHLGIEILIEFPMI
jgi:hypothetical protein